MKTDYYYIPDKNRHEIFSAIKKELEKEPSLAFAYLYGSIIEREMIHDIDVGIYFTRQAYQESEIKLSKLADQCSVAIKLPVDIRVLNNAPLSFFYHVLRGKLLLCRDEEVLASLLEDIPRRYLDLAPIFRQSTKDAFAA